MTLREAIRSRKTSNGHFDPRPVSIEHQRMLVEAAERAPSHFNSQPWRFILIDDPQVRSQIATIGGRTMTQLIEGGSFFTRYRKYFRFSQEEMDERRDGIFIDQMPMALRPFIKQVFSDNVMNVLSKLGVAKLLGEDNRKLIEGSPLLLAALLTKEEYKPGELSGYYCTLSLGMAIEHVWLMTGELGMGIQFVSTPMEIPEAWDELKSILNVPDDLELMAVYRLGYLPPEKQRPRIDWRSDHRKRLSQIAFRNTCATPEPDAPSTL
ncbi:MAG: nitroreductase family protein [Ignavibacteria bacterium]|nr:nitroreductase family protein [Ignavibacteria bacterium]MBK6761046.1 nitroreductase family protein [Ignavibacteria bacterium]MBK7186777.1 nitroreductase family protein [Ignavibacteria bacterium]MBK7412215.1 nitroreductase family protein [Ignavibacteria bacterium]MBK9183639.1 nitroreductase family protein [Ignavibacteria bacterium]